MAKKKLRLGAALAAEHVADELHSAAIHLLRRLRRLDDKSDLAAPQLSALSVIVFGGPLTLGELATAEQIRPASVTHIVRQLEAAGLVKRQTDASDGRRIILTATKAGSDILQQGRSRRVQELARYIKSLPKSDRDALRTAAALMEDFAKHSNV
jgi:DNA-binding MarR family transcriptional regulator